MIDLERKQKVWSEQLPVFKENYILTSDLNFLDFDMITGQFDINPNQGNDGFDNEDSLVLYHSVNTAWAMWLRCNRLKQAEIDSLKAQFAKVESSKAAFDVLGERNRQIEQEHYSIKHDDYYQMNELSRAAASYVNNVVSRGWVFNSVYGPEAYQSEEVPDLWPWSDEHWKPKNPRRDLVKAAALIIAEIDRMDRSSEGEQS